MTSSTSAGSTLAISVSVPATDDAEGYEALAYTEVGQVEKIGAIGAAIAKVEFQPLKGPKQKHKGAVDFGSLQPTMALDETDAGQAIVRTASENMTSKLYSFRVQYPNGSKRYFRGRAFGFPESVDGADTIIVANPTIEISTKVVRVGAVPEPDDGWQLDFANADLSGLLTLILEDF